MNCLNLSSSCLPIVKKFLKSEKNMKKSLIHLNLFSIYLKKAELELSFFLASTFHNWGNWFANLQHLFHWLPFQEEF